MSFKAPSDPVVAHIGERIRQLRIERRMSQTVLGNRVGLSYQQIQKYERGNDRVAVSNLYRLSQALDVPIDVFFPTIEEVGQTPDLSVARQIRRLEPAVRSAIIGVIRAIVSQTPPAPSALPPTDPV